MDQTLNISFPIPCNLVDELREYPWDVRWISIRHYAGETQVLIPYGTEDHRTVLVNVAETLFSFLAFKGET